MNKKTNSSRELYFRLLSYLTPYWLVLVVSVISLLILSSSESAFAAILEKMIDKIFVEQDKFYVYAIPIALIIVAFVRGIMNFIGVITINWVATRVVMDLRQAMFKRLLGLPMQFYSDNSSGSIISKFTYDSSQVTAAATETFVTIIRDTFTILFLIALMLYYNWQLTLISFLSFPIIALAVFAVSKRMRKLNIELQTSMGKMTSVIEESTIGQKVVKIFGGEKYEKGRFDDISNWIRRYGNKVKMTSTASVSIVQLITAVALAVIVFIAAKDATSATKDFTAGQFSAFFTAMGLLFTPIKRLTKINERLQKGIAASYSIFKLIDTPIEDNSGKKIETPLQGNISFKDVEFKYSNMEKNAINGISFSIEKGQTVALVGQSGSGKTTIASLLPRFYNIGNGSIEIDQININDLNLFDLRNNISLVSQDVVLFNDTVAANIAYGSMQNASRDEIINAAKAANAMEFIENMPEGIDTLIGENGAKISGGQRQRIAIARAILKNAPILILDEATSALDTESEYFVQKALENLQEGKTTLVIAHRLSTIENADRIIVLEQGKVIEEGSHKELINNTNGHYYKLHNAQQGQQ